MELKVELMKGRDAMLPEKKHNDDACYDLYTAEEFVTPDLVRGECFKIPLGIKISVPKGYEAQIRPRSGITLKGCTYLKNPHRTKCKAFLTVELGTIDAGYAGEVCVIARTHQYMRFGIIPAHTRIAQMKISRVYDFDIVQVDSIDADTERGANGFGSTGQ